MRRALAAIAVAVVLAAAGYWLLGRDTTVTANVHVPVLVAQVGSGEGAVGIDDEGDVVRWLPVPDEPALPELPLKELPKGGRVTGTVLEQVQVLAAAPPPLRAFVAASSYGESGVELELTSGIELRFGEASRAEEKWRAVAAILADPSITALTYVNVQAPSRPAYYGEEHALPSSP